MKTKVDRNWYQTFHFDKLSGTATKRSITEPLCLKT
jgi:hypothetical protein